MSGKIIIIVLIAGVLLASCAQAEQPEFTESDIQTAIAQTHAASPIQTHELLVPTNTPPPEPTATNLATDIPEPTETTAPEPTSTKSVDELRKEICEGMIEVLEAFDDVSSVTLCRFGNGQWDLELKTNWASKDRQPDVSYSVARLISEMFTDVSPFQAGTLAGGETLRLYLVTYSIEGDYRYESTTHFPTLKKLQERLISYAEWVDESNAGFR